MLRYAIPPMAYISRIHFSLRLGFRLYLKAKQLNLNIALALKTYYSRMNPYAYFTVLVPRHRRYRQELKQNFAYARKGINQYVTHDYRGSVSSVKASLGHAQQQPRVCCRLQCALDVSSLP
jgi:hypothetical protein